MKGNKNTANFIDKYIKKNINPDALNHLVIDVGFVNYSNGQVDYYIDYLITNKNISEDVPDDSTRVSKGRMVLSAFEPDKEDTYKVLDEAVKEFEKKIEQIINQEDEILVDKKQFVLDNFNAGIIKHIEDNINSLEGVLSYYKNSHPYESDLLLEELYEDINTVIECNISIENKIQKMCEDLKNMA